MNLILFPYTVFLLIYYYIKWKKQIRITSMAIAEISIESALKYLNCLSFNKFLFELRKFIKLQKIDKERQKLLLMKKILEEKKEFLNYNQLK